MHVERLVEWPAIFDPPPELLRRLRAIRPNAELIYIGDGRWWLGEVRWNSEKARRAGIMIKTWWQNRKDEGVTVLTDPHHIAFLRDAQLLYQGFAYIREYFGDPDGRIVNDYQRMCWKEDHDILEQEVQHQLSQSDDRTSLQKRIKIVTDRIRAEAKSDHSIIFNKRRSVNLYVPPKPNLLVPRANRKRIITV